MGRYAIGCDIGGTFTDVVAVDLDTGEQLTAKALSTPPLYVAGVINALQKVGIPPLQIEIIRHGATISTNAVLQRRGANIGLVTTEGFRGIYPGARSERMGAFELNWDPPDPLVLPRDVIGVRERMSPEGEVITPLHEEDVRRAARIFRKRGKEAIAVCYMDSFVNPAHERRTKEILQEECPAMYVTISYEVLPRMLEFERFSTTVLNAYLGPVMTRYMHTLSSRLREWGYHGDVLITHSGGGVMSVEEALRLPVRTCHSSPVSGVVGFAGQIARLAGHQNCIAFETGGTTNDVSMIFQGEPTRTNEWRILWNTPCCLPSIETTYIGAGGGSIGWIDHGGALKIGPQSAGSSPGPACFGLGGAEPTITDAQLVLGRLDPNYFLGGEIPLYPDLARRAIKERIADHYGWTVEQAASAMLKVATANLMIALRLQSVARGWHPKDFALVAYGGGGAFYAADLAREMGIPTAVVPPLPGYGSATGALHVPLVHELSVPVHRTESEVDTRELNERMNELVAAGRAILVREGVPEERMEIQRLADMKYFDQFRFLTVDAPPGELSDLSGLKENYRAAMRQEYGYDLPAGLVEIEICNLRVRAIGKIPVPQFRTLEGQAGGAENALKARRDVYFEETGGFVAAAIYERSALPRGALVHGPAIVEQKDTTTILPPNTGCRVDDYGNLIISQ